MALDIEKLVSIIGPKPKFNLDFYHGEDLYSDGDVEDEIIEMIAKNAPDDYNDAIYANYKWATFYHLTQMRQNILNWYPFKAGSSVLEIGCGFGAITGLLCDKCESVTSVELSKRRATGALLRCREKDNLEIIVGNLNEIKFEKKYDYITLIGVLEYQGSYTDGENPYQEFLKKVKSLLKPNGKLLIAIENQYGIKYWCGAVEDHTTVPFDGINGYVMTDRKVRTFSRKGLEKLIKDSGFANTYFYYPMPDYKLPTVIYSEKHLPSSANMENVNYYYIPSTKYLIGNEAKVSEDIIENGVFEFFANSFLVECSDDDTIGEMKFTCASSLRLKDYQMLTSMTKDGKVVKRSCIKGNAERHLDEIMQNEHNLIERGVAVCVGERMGDTLVYPFLEGDSLEKQYLKACEEKNVQKMYEILDAVWNCILMSSDEVALEENIMYSLGIGDVKNSTYYGPILKNAYIDMLLRNSIINNGQLTWIDQEWVLENAPAKFAFFRMITELYIPYPHLENVLPFAQIFEKYGLMECFEDFQELNKLFFDVVIDRKMCSERGGLPGIDENVIKQNIINLL